LPRGSDSKNQYEGPIRRPVALPRLLTDTRVALPAAAVVVAGVIALDFATWIELDMASIYPIALVVAALPRRRGFLWTAALLLAVSTFVVYAYQAPPGVFRLNEPYFVNRLLDLVGIAVTTILLRVWIRSVEIRESQVRLLDDKNRELEAANARIAAQNELLERRRREAEEASGRKSALLAAVSHDIRSPLSSIQLTAEIIRRTVSDPALAVEIPGMAQRLHANAASLLEVASELIEVGSFDTGRVVRHVSEFEVRELVAAKCGEVLPLAQAKMLELAIDAPEQAILVATDRTKLGRILSNLLTNAVKFTREGSVRAAIVEIDGDVAISISDTGSGIPSDRLARIFDGAGEVRDAAGGRDRGFGLGLAICRRLADVIGAKLAVQSEPGRGSVFTVRLPASVVRAGVAAAGAHSPTGNA
jgi:signal transduction histidine kinase